MKSGSPYALACAIVLHDPWHLSGISFVDHYTASRVVGGALMSHRLYITEWPNESGAVPHPHPPPPWVLPPAPGVRVPADPDGCLGSGVGTVSSGAAER